MVQLFLCVCGKTPMHCVATTKKRLLRRAKNIAKAHKSAAKGTFDL